MKNDKNFRFLLIKININTDSLSTYELSSVSHSNMRGDYNFASKRLIKKRSVSHSDMRGDYNR